jgi:hypothetical protein
MADFVPESVFNNEHRQTIAAAAKVLGVTTDIYGGDW